MNRLAVVVAFGRSVPRACAGREAQPRSVSHGKRRVASRTISAHYRVIRSSQAKGSPEPPGQPLPQAARASARMDEDD
jgi:hypothetical protein